MHRKNMELSDKECVEVVEKLEVETALLEETQIVESIYSQLLKKKNCID